MKIGFGLALAVTVLAFDCNFARAQDATAGEAVFAQCTACHSLDGSNGIGPSLRGIIGRKAGSSPGFRYSRAMKNLRSNWDEAALDAYIADPQATVPGNLMPFSGIVDKKQRDDLIAFLLTLK
jgi:cytochrome c